MLVFLVLLLCTWGVSAESKDTQHDKDIKEVLFGKAGIPGNEEALALLQWASYFAMDCIGKENKDEQEALDKLRDYGVAGVPRKVTAFHYKGNRNENQHHERSTHRGWNSELYGTESEDIASWNKLRKPLFVNTFIRIFTQGKKNFWESVDLLHLFKREADPTTQKQCESLAAVVYYIHILGDHYENRRSTLPDRIPLVREHVNDRNPDLLNELKIHLAVLFRSQTKTSQYMHLINSIDQIRKDWPNNVGVYDYNIINDDQYTNYQTEAKKLMNLLKEEVYPLLKNEKFFADVFYPSSASR